MKREIYLVFNKMLHNKIFSFFNEKNDFIFSFIRVNLFKFKNLHENHHHRNMLLNFLIFSEKRNCLHLKKLQELY